MRKLITILVVVPLLAAMGCETATEPGDPLAPDGVVLAEVVTSAIFSPEGGTTVYGDELNLAAFTATGSVQWAVRFETCAVATNTRAGNVDGFSTPFGLDDGHFSATIDVAAWERGAYCFVFNTGQDRLTSEFTLADPRPYVRITFMCQVPEDTPHSHVRFFTGTDTELHPAGPGQWIWRIGDARDGHLWEGAESAHYWTNFLGMTGTAALGVANFHATDDPAAGVNVSTDPGPNLYGGTASANPGQVCTMETPPPTAKDQCMNGGWQLWGFRNQGQCIASLMANENSQH